MSQVVIITGALGLGKSTIASLLTDELAGTIAHVSGDTFSLAVKPWMVNDERRLFIRGNLASFARHAIKHEYDWIILDHVFLKDEYVQDLIHRIGLPTDDNHVIALTALRKSKDRVCVQSRPTQPIETAL